MGKVKQNHDYETPDDPVLVKGTDLGRELFSLGKHLKHDVSLIPKKEVRG